VQVRLLRSPIVYGSAAWFRDTQQITREMALAGADVFFANKGGEIRGIRIHEC